MYTYFRIALHYSIILDHLLVPLGPPFEVPLQKCFTHKNCPKTLKSHDGSVDKEHIHHGLDEEVEVDKQTGVRCGLIVSSLVRE